MKATFLFIFFSIVIFSGCQKQEPQPQQPATSSPMSASMTSNQSCCLSNIVLPAKVSMPLTFHVDSCVERITVSPYGDGTIPSPIQYTMQVTRTPISGSPTTSSILFSSPVSYDCYGIADFAISYFVTSTGRPFNMGTYSLTTG